MSDNDDDSGISSRPTSAKSGVCNLIQIQETKTKEEEEDIFIDVLSEKFNISVILDV